MARLRLSADARNDLAEIRRYIARDNPVRAKTFVEELRAHCHRLASHPHVHAIFDKVDSRARKAVHGTYLIYYEVAVDGILVLRVLHSARDLSMIALRPDPGNESH